MSDDGSESETVARASDDRVDDNPTPKSPRRRKRSQVSDAASADRQTFDALLDYLRRMRGLDLTGYKTASLMRRIEKRMAALDVVGFQAFIDYLEVHPEEFRSLFNELLINVTGFFRDPDAWAALTADVLQPLGEARGGSDPIRFWSAGCASGEEAYSLAIAVAEAIGIEAFKTRVKIYATDADEMALVQARQGSYDERALGVMDLMLRDRYFERTRDGRFAFRPDLRRALIFGRHDLMHDAPISRVDVLACRNVLMYFNAEMQSRILGRFAMALNPTGVLFLGRAETLLSRTTLFTPLDLKQRLFTRLRQPTLRDRMGVQDDAFGDDPEPVGRPPSFGSLHAAFDASPVAQVVINSEGIVAFANAQARALFQIAPADIGRPLQDLELSYRPLDLRSRLDEVNRTERTVTVSGVIWGTPLNIGGTCDVLFVPLLGDRGQSLGVGISFVDTSKHSRLQREVEHAHQELETAYEELQSTNEELETTNEELQSTVEELETTNEELQSTNEELETMNEELQSTNEELESINDALRARDIELDELNGYLSSILSSLQGAVVALDEELRVTAWNDTAEEYWGVRTHEVIGRNFFSLDIGLPLEALHAPIRAALAGEPRESRLSIDGRNRRGSPMRADVTCVPLQRNESVRGVLLMVVDAPGREVDG